MREYIITSSCLLIYLPIGLDIRARERLTWICVEHGWHIVVREFLVNIGPEETSLADVAVADYY